MAALFRKISPAAARLETLLARRTRGLSFPAGGAAWTFSAGERGSGDHGVAVYGTLGPSEFSLWLDEPGWRTVAAAVLGTRPEDVPALPPTLVQAALECFFSEALAHLEKAVGLPVALSRLEIRETPPLMSSFPFRLVRADGLIVSGAWTAGGDAWREPLEKALRSLAPPAEPLPESLVLEGEITAGVWRMAAGGLRELERGDVVLLPETASWNLTVGRRFRFAAVYEKGKIVADGKAGQPAPSSGSEVDEKGKSVADGKSVAPANPPAPEAKSATAATATDRVELATLDEAEVELRAEVGRLDVTLAELRRLTVGEVVEFATPVDAPITLVAGGRAVAVGELVDVGGRVGVRVTAMAGEREERG